MSALPFFLRLWHHPDDMPSLRTAFLFVCFLTSIGTPALAQSDLPSTGAPTTFQVELEEGSNLISLPLLPDSSRIGFVVASALPHLTFVQDDAGHYFIPNQGIDGIGVWAWNEAYRITVTAPTVLVVEGPAILPETSPLLLDGQVGNWVPYFRSEPMAVEEAFASIATSLSRVEASDGRFYYPGDEASTLDSLRTGHGYRVWVSQPTTLTYPANPTPPVEEDTTPPAPPTGLVASPVNGAVVLNWNDNTEGDLADVPYIVKRSGVAGGPYTPIAVWGQTAYSDGTVVNGTTYYYVVTASDASGNQSPPSAEVAATPDGPAEEDTTPPAAPTGLTASAGNGAVTLNWNDNTEGDLADAPYTVKRSAASAGPYNPIATVNQSGFTDAAVVNGTTYYYVITATDTSGNESPPSVGAVATPQAPAETGPFALPSSPTPTATDEAIGMRAEFRDDPKGFNNHLTTAYDGATTQGERLWIGVGGTGYDWGHPLPAVEPDGAGGIRSTYVTAAGTLSELPPLGVAPGTGGYPAPYIFGHEGTDIGASVSYPDGSTAVHFLIMDGGPSPNFSYRFVEESNGTQRLDTIRVYGTIWENGAKNHALEATDRGMVAIHAHSSPYHTNTPNILVNRGDDANFFVPGASSGGSANLTFRLGAVGDEIYIVTNERPILSVVTELGADSAFVQRLIVDPATFWGNQAPINNGFGPTPRYIGPAAGNPGFVIYTGGASRLDYHNGVTGSVIPVDEQSAYMYQRIGSDTWRVTYPDLRVQRLAALSVGPTAATPTWVTEADLDLPTGWEAGDVTHIEITENGSVWLIGERPATFPASGVTEDDIAVAYYRGGGTP